MLPLRHLKPRRLKLLWSPNRVNPHRQIAHSAKNRPIRYHVIQGTVCRHRWVGCLYLDLTLVNDFANDTHPIELPTPRCDAYHISKDVLRQILSESSLPEVDISVTETLDTNESSSVIIPLPDTVARGLMTSEPLLTTPIPPVIGRWDPYVVSRTEILRVLQHSNEMDIHILLLDTYWDKRRSIRVVLPSMVARQLTELGKKLTQNLH